jgi:hypothetical protein
MSVPFRRRLFRLHLAPFVLAAAAPADPPFHRTVEGFLAPLQI